MIIAIKEIILSHESLNKKYYVLLLNYLTSLTEINLPRMSFIAENLRLLFFALADSKNDISVKFVIDFLSFLTNLCVRKYISESANEGGSIEAMNKVEFCLNFINHLAEKKNDLINVEILRIYENLIDKNGYEIPASFWKLILEKIEFILGVYEKSEISSDISKTGLFKSFQYTAKNSLKLYFFFRRTAFINFD